MSKKCSKKKSYKNKKNSIRAKRVIELYDSGVARDETPSKTERMLNSVRR